jgi:hypothetical protein
VVGEGQYCLSSRTEIRCRIEQEDRDAGGARCKPRRSEEHGKSMEAYELMIQRTWFAKCWEGMISWRYHDGTDHSEGTPLYTTTGRKGWRPSLGDRSLSLLKDLVYIGLGA